MRQGRPATFIVAATAGLALVAVLSGCSGGASPSATRTVTATATATPIPSASGSASGGTGAASGPADTGDGGDGGGVTGTSATRCQSDSLRGRIVDNGGGAAGSVDVAIELTVTGTGSCTLQGWPGVSFVGDGNGTQIGAPAVLDRGVPHPTVTVRNDRPARFPLRIVQAANLAAGDCTPTPADGFRVYPPGSKTSLFIAQSGYTACAKSSAQSLLSVQAATQG